MIGFHPGPPWSTVKLPITSSTLVFGPPSNCDHFQQYPHLFNFQKHETAENRNLGNYQSIPSVQRRTCGSSLTSRAWQLKLLPLHLLWAFFTSIRSHKLSSHCVRCERKKKKFKTGNQNSHFFEVVPEAEMVVTVGLHCAAETGKSEFRFLWGGTRGQCGS